MSSPRTHVGRLVAVAAVVAIGAVACGSSSKKSSSTTGPTTSALPKATAPAANGGRRSGNPKGLALGFLLPKTGDLSSVGPPMFKGSEMAVRDINAAGGVNGKTVSYAEEDDGGGNFNDVAKTSAAKLLNQNNVDVIVGGASSGTTNAVIGDIVGKGTVECSPSNTAASLTAYPDRGLYFRTVPPDQLQGPALAKVVTNDGHSRIGVIALDNPYGQGFVPYLRQGLSSAGAKIVKVAYINPKGTTFDADVQSVLSAKPDAIVMIDYPDTGGSVLKSLIQAGKGPGKFPIYVSDGMQSNTLYQQVDPKNKAATEGVIGTAASSAPKGGAAFFTPEFKTFAAGVKSPLYSAQSYDCVVLAALAAEKAKSNAPFDIAKAWDTLTSPSGTVCSKYSACKTLVDQGKDIHYIGASGDLNLNAYGEPKKGDYEVYKFGADGSYTTYQHVSTSA